MKNDEEKYRKHLDYMNEYMKKRYLKNKIDKTNKYIENEILKKT